MHRATRQQAIVITGYRKVFLQIRPFQPLNFFPIAIRVNIKKTRYAAK